ncbi:MAG TPA: phage Gp37/Gp68 family protein [Dehalococcoidia bacterium]|nr:phage Gp37/Gp68 family protein [Dehalococcoidia bacterium]
MNGTAISWTNATWNPTTGCSRVSDGCRHCYAEALSLRFGWSTKPWTAGNAAENVVLHPERLRHPYRLKRPSMIFVNSMSDLFHEQVPDAYIAQVFAVMAATPQHTYQILTKRPERAAAWPGPWLPHMWMGTSVEDARVTHRIDTLRTCGARIRFLSCEPLLGPIPGIDLHGIDWLIAGGESGWHMKSPDNPRWMRQEWARALRDACVAQHTAFFYKQDSGPRTELRPWLVEEDGSCWEWHQLPGHLTPPRLVTAPAARVPSRQAVPV